MYAVYRSLLSLLIINSVGPRNSFSTNNMVVKVVNGNSIHSVQRLRRSGRFLKEDSISSLHVESVLERRRIVKVKRTYISLFLLQKGINRTYLLLCDILYRPHRFLYGTIFLLLQFPLHKLNL